ncbi:hypothetical protein BpHYR1_007525 [Brachionus plicatilis]|uniref:MULE transposase domain-containing protein n=1 Tax=Brachionus plicatilis TaxID=10195 RepID=A0A3M7PUA9_BRAPC|nr:hypothetical protein BpHYR1_007525 [Brachionus plicatilis]
MHPILVIKNNEKPPSIVLAFFVHEKKFERSHNEFWRFIGEILPEMSDLGYIVTVCEDAFRNAIKIYFPNIPLLRCWNHFWKSTERWIISNKKFTTDDVGFYCDSVIGLFLQPNKALFELQLENKINVYTNSQGRLIPAWRTEFVDYYEKCIKPDINCLASFAVKPNCESDV